MKSDADLKRDGALAVIKQTLDATKGDPAMQDNVRRHYEHLEKLAANLRKLGMDERDISDELMQVFKSYETALMDYVRAA